MKPSKTALFLSHGGGPLPILGDPQHAEMVGLLREIASQIKRPSAIIVVSAHWEEEVASITSGANPNLIYDYFNFPPEAYQIGYPCPGEPDLAKEVFLSLKNLGIAAELNPSRGFDHGVFVPLKIMYPEADIPCIQLSLLKSLDPDSHISLGKSLQAIEREDLLIIGSGFSFHNMRAFFSKDNELTLGMNQSFEEWLRDTCANQSMTESERRLRLLRWETAPNARYCHPREEHLLPLHVCYGYAEAPCSEAYSLEILGKKASMYLWQAPNSGQGVKG